MAYIVMAGAGQEPNSYGLYSYGLKKKEPMVDGPSDDARRWANTLAANMHKCRACMRAYVPVLLRFDASMLRCFDAARVLLLLRVFASTDARSWIAATMQCSLGVGYSSVVVVL